MSQLLEAQLVIMKRSSQWGVREESWWKRVWTDTDQNNTAEIKSSNDDLTVYIPLLQTNPRYVMAGVEN